ncbi:hypothetical protein V6N12_054200 [Hibiscus sabdariffa]|uniref:Endonuclease/exonuclease/phosphatase domain-containing protein n=1 Tax=Hibiscus sabdariffa TaxID=183260 RepID=A0ABR1ZHF2_9ROSI
MRMLAWNVLTLKKRVVQRLLRKHKCEMVVLLETKLEEITDRMVSRIWHTDNFAYVFSPSVGKAGGILLVWEKGRFDVTAMTSANRFFVVEGNWVNENWFCCVMGVYAPCFFEEQCRLWEEIGAIISAKSMPWYVCGDFNMITNIEEHGGGSSFS